MTVGARRKTIFVFLCLLAGAARAAPVCSEFEIALDVIRARPLADASDREWDAYDARASASYAKIAYDDFQRYLDRDAKPFEVDACLSDAERLRLRSLLPSAFFTLSASEILAWDLPKSSAFAVAVADRFRSGEVAGFGLDDPSPTSPPSLRLAGFNKCYRGLYLNPQRLPSNEWFIVFTHEFSHALDETLAEATAQASDAEFPSLAGKTTNVGEIDAWVQNGLDRGLLAEYRAWASTAAVYVEARAANRLDAVGWFDEMIGPDRTDARRARLSIFAKLDAAFKDPTSAPYDRPLVAARLKALRARLRNEADRGRPPPIGSLGFFFADSERPSE